MGKTTITKTNEKGKRSKSKVLSLNFVYNIASKFVESNSIA